jgi:septal ring factor EnvC (AmiA/AmiB activator)
MEAPAQNKIHKSVDWVNIVFAHTERACALVLLCSLTLILTGGCGPQVPQSVKRSRTIAAENIELRKALDRRNKEIETLKTQYGEKIDEQREQLRKCLQEKEQLKEKSRQNVRNQVSSVLDTVMQENKKLREENARLKAQIEKLQK